MSMCEPLSIPSCPRCYVRIARIDGDVAQLPLIASEIDRIDGSARSSLDAAFRHLEAVRRAGTPVFAHLARAAFVATSLLRSLETVGAIDATEHAQFLGSVE